MGRLGQMQQTRFLGLSPENANFQGPPCELWFTVEDLGRISAAGIVPWGGAGWLVVLLAALHPQFPQMVSVVFDSGEEAIIRDLTIDTDAPLRPFVAQSQAQMDAPAPSHPAPPEDEIERLLLPFQLGSLD